MGRWLLWPQDGGATALWGSSLRRVGLKTACKVPRVACAATATLLPAASVSRGAPGAS